MPNRTDVLLEPRSFSIAPGEIVNSTTTVQNSGDTVSQFTFRIEGLASDWYNLSVSSTTLFPNDQEELSITFHPPRTDEVKPGLYTCHLIVDCQENPDDTADVVFTLEIKDIPELKLEITPETITGKNGLYKVVVHNPGVNAATLKLQVVNHDAILRCKLLPIYLSVPGGSSSESSLEIKLGWLHIFRSKSEYDFTVITKQADSGQVKTINGRLIKIPRNIRLPFKLSPLVRIRRHRQPPDIVRFEATTEDKRTFNLTWSIEHAAEARLNDVRTEFQGYSKEVYPAEATSYVLTATNKYGSVSRKVDIEPLSIPKEKYSDRILVLMTPNTLQVAAGGEPTEATVEIQNIGTIVDRFSLEIEGLAESWYSLSAPSVSLMPHAKEQVQVSFHPPKVTGVTSDNYPFAVTLQSQTIPEDSASTTAQLDILPAVDFGISVKPYRIHCRRKCTFQVQITNKDVAEASVFIDVTDIESGLSLKLENDSPVVSPWQNIEIPMLVKPKRNSIVGDIKRYDISVTASTAEGYTQLARCQMDHKPLLSSWRPILRTLKYIIVFGIAGFALYYIIRLGGGWGSLARDPQSWLDGTIRHIRGWFY